MRAQDRLHVEVGERDFYQQPRHPEKILLTVQDYAAVPVRRVLGLVVKIIMVRAFRRQNKWQPAFREVTALDDAGDLRYQPRRVREYDFGMGRERGTVLLDDGR